MKDSIVIYKDLFGNGLSNEQFQWTPYIQNGRTNVNVKWLYKAEETGLSGAEAYIANFLPNSCGDLHLHTGFEMLLILSGELEDDSGHLYTAGTLFLERPNSIHQVSSKNGCVALVVREKCTLPILNSEV